jgi:hypothetical protein
MHLQLQQRVPALAGRFYGMEMQDIAKETPLSIAQEKDMTVETRVQRRVVRVHMMGQERN